MKRCPKCGQTFTEPDINFCLNDGELLSRDLGEALHHDDDPPPTLLMDPPRVTNQSNWPISEPPVLYQEPSMRAPDQFGSLDRPKAPDQTLATVSLGLGIASAIFVCCYGGFWLGLPAGVVGFLAMRNIQNDPEASGGRGLAIGGMVLGIITFVISILFIILAVLA